MRNQVFDIPYAYRFKADSITRNTVWRTVEEAHKTSSVLVKTGNQMNVYVSLHYKYVQVCHPHSVSSLWGLTVLQYTAHTGLLALVSSHKLDGED